MRIHGGQHAYGVLLAIVAVAFLAVGSLLKPPRPKNAATSAPEITTIQGELARLREITQRNTLRNTTARFNDAAKNAVRHAIVTLPNRRPGWVIDGDGTFITASDEAGPSEPFRVLHDGSAVQTTALTGGAGLPYAIARPEENFAPAAATLPLDQVSPGAWILLVSLNSSGGVIFSPGNYGGRREISCGDQQFPRLLSNIPMDDSSVGAAVFDFEGRLLGLVVRCDGEIDAVSVYALRNSAQAVGPSLPLRQRGFLGANLDNNWTALLKRSSGIVISDVWNGWPAEQAGLSPGDVIVSVNGRPVQNLADMEALIAGNAGDLKLQLRRSAKSVSAVLRRGTFSPVSIEVENPQAGVQVRAVQNGSSIARAGLKPGDRILRVNGVRATPLTVNRVLSADKVQAPVLLLARRGERQFARVILP